MNKRSQVWIETVVYTLIALIIIGAVLGFVKPKIEELQDKAIVEQSLGMLQQIDTEISSIVKGGQGNQRVLEISIKKGELTIDSVDDSIKFYMEGAYTYSEPGMNISVGGITAYTQKIGSVNKITLTKTYKDYDLMYDNSNIIKNLEKSPTPYNLVVYNEGGDSTTNKIKINFAIS